METTELSYPVFEANQVLSNAHLNDMFEYLDEQTRATRADLIGIGIACGLEPSVASGAVTLTRGCGVTSQGFLVVEPGEDLTLGFVRPYSLPLDPGYQPFMKPGSNPPAQYELWEMFADDDEPGALPFASSGLKASQVAVVLFLELRRDRSRSCSPKGCDDRGSEVVTTLRRLLVDKASLRSIIEAGRDAGPTVLAVDVAERLQLPDLRLPRWDVPNSSRTSAEQVLEGFQRVFGTSGLAHATDAALRALFAAFKPLVLQDFPGGDPFAPFLNRFGFLDGTPSTQGQVRFLQYYVDLFDDLLAAYSEVRAKGIDLVCACCPPQGLFPRHVVAGPLVPDSLDVFEYRSRFLPSPAVSRCVERGQEVRMLFRRLVEMVERFFEVPFDQDIRITPSNAAVPLSSKAIPYYYGQGGSPRLYELWNPERTRERRADQNLGFRSDEYTPAAPAFVTDPLRYDLEPYDFLRIEGHLGADVQSALKSLLALRRQHRLPFDVIAVRASEFDETAPLDPTEGRCRFQDLEAIYRTLVADLRCFLLQQVRYYYALPLSEQGPVTVGQVALTPTLSILKELEPDFVVRPGTIGHGIERMRSWSPGTASPFPMSPPGVPNLPVEVMALTAAISGLTELLPQQLDDLEPEAFGEQHSAMLGIATAIDASRRDGRYDRPGLAERLDDLLHRCGRDPFEALVEERRRRLREAKKEQYLGTFLEHHPGVQHKAGVPIGGTFILVYHQRPATQTPSTRPSRGRTDVRVPLLEGLTSERLWSALSRLDTNESLHRDPDILTIRNLLPKLLPQMAVSVGSPASGIYARTVENLADGTVIADLFLPYGCRSDCQPIQFQMPPTRLRVRTAKSCTNADDRAEVTVAADGALGELSVQVDGGAFQQLTGPLHLEVGDHVLLVRDATGNESPPVELTIPPRLVIDGGELAVDEAAGTWLIKASISGGAPPYVAVDGVVIGADFVSPAVPIDKPFTIEVTDAAGCTAAETFESGAQPCDLPCDGEAIREGFRFWMPEAKPRLPINDWKVEVRSSAVTAPDGTVHDVADRMLDAVNRGPASIRSTDFEQVVAGWLEGAQKVIAEALGAEDWVRLEYLAADGAATNGTLFIDRLACIAVELDLLVSFVQGGRERQFELSFTREGTLVVEQQSDSKLLIPPFTISTVNRCRAGDRPKSRCEGTDLDLRIVHEGDRGALTLLAEVGGNDLPVALVWEVPDGTPSIAAGERIEVSFESIEPSQKSVRLTAFTERGCTVTVEEIIDIAGG